MFTKVEKMIVAAEGNATADAIAALRGELTGDTPIRVNQDGSVENPADPMSASSLANGSGFKPVDKAVVAAEGNATADAIAALRGELTGDTPIRVNQDGSVENPADPMSASSLANGSGFKPVDKAVVAAESNPTADAIAKLRDELTGDETIYVDPYGTIKNPADPMTASSLANGSGFKPVDKAVVAAESNPTADAIAKLRDELTGDETIYVDPYGTIKNPADPMTASSLANGSGFKPVDKAVVAAQWYQLNPALQKAEIKAMADIHPDARMGYLPNGKMYWTMRLRPVVCGSRKDWTLLAVYDSDHPQRRWGGSVKFYPVKPNYQEMMEMVNRSSVMPKTIPHLLQDEDKQIYMCTQHMNNVHDGQHRGELVTTAASCLRFAMRWITVFELGLIDQTTWSLFQQHGKI